MASLVLLLRLSVLGYPEPPRRYAPARGNPLLRGEPSDRTPQYETLPTVNRPRKPFASSAISQRAAAITIGLALLLTSLTLRAGRTASPSQAQQPSSSGGNSETPFLFGADWP